MKKYKYIIIAQKNEETFEEKPVYRISNNKSGEQLGIISYYKSWKQYVFSSQPQCIFNNSCLHDVIDFMENQIDQSKKFISEWIKCSEKLPENEQLVYYIKLYGKNPFVYEGIYDQEDDEFDDTDDLLIHTSSKYVLFWMPRNIPTLPEEKILNESIKSIYDNR